MLTENYILLKLKENIFLISVLIVIKLYFGSTIYSAITSSSANSNNKISIGNKWFVGLLIINLAIVIFICAFYYSKTHLVGDKGLTGQIGFPGSQGYDCKIPLKNGKCT